MKPGRLKTVPLKFCHLQKCIISLLYANNRKVFHSFLRVLYSDPPSLLPYVQLSLGSNDIVVNSSCQGFRRAIPKKVFGLENMLCVLGTA